MTSYNDEMRREADWDNFHFDYVNLKNVVARHFGLPEKYDHWVMADFLW